jgi:hypothetical protein
MKSLPIEKVLFLDIEASGLEDQSWPIEVGLSRLVFGPDGFAVDTWSSLLRPAPEWPQEAWSLEAEAVHGIPRQALADARTAETVAREVGEMLRARHVLSDAPEFDERWLATLLQSADIPVVTVLDYDAVSASVFGHQDLHLVYRSLERTPLPHRAGPDSARLAIAWRDALNGR